MVAEKQQPDSKPIIKLKYLLRNIIFQMSFFWIVDFLDAKSYSELWVQTEFTMLHFKSTCQPVNKNCR